MAALALLACDCVASSTAAADGREVIGHSVEGRPIVLFASGAPDATLKVLVVGDIHGDETAGMRIASHLIAGPAPRRPELMVVPTINPAASPPA